VNTLIQFLLVHVGNPTAISKEAFMKLFAKKVIETSFEVLRSRKGTTGRAHPAGAC
jgi:hypothetical protein